MPGHWLLARLGKRVLRPGGAELTRWMLDALGVDPEDRVVELAAGLGATARLTLTRRPAAYTAVDRDPAAVAALSALATVGPTTLRAVRSDAGDTGLPDGDATVVYGEAMLTMQPEPAKRRVVREAHRLLDDSTAGPPTFTASALARPGFFPRHPRARQLDGERPESTPRDARADTMRKSRTGQGRCHNLPNSYNSLCVPAQALP
ncbi:class I SAM-dependent methyltransferase [Streptomyces sp. NBC_00444]|uniref:class I SAM-dependent methyltransferase n=1 Tax=Streptomyces sp. NBC_00444 TaxID=2975744 RepID=UPI002E20C816